MCISCAGDSTTVMRCHSPFQTMHASPAPTSMAAPGSDSPVTRSLPLITYRISSPSGWTSPLCGGSMSEVRVTTPIVIPSILLGGPGLRMLVETERSRWICRLWLETSTRLILFIPVYRACVDAACRGKRIGVAYMGRMGCWAGSGDKVEHSDVCHSQRELIGSRACNSIGYHVNHSGHQNRRSGQCAGE